MGMVSHDDAGWGKLRLIHQSSLAILQEESSGSKYEEWIKE
jgi:hypothetical protein